MSTLTTALFKTCCFYGWLSENFKKPGFDRNLHLEEIGNVSLNNLGINIDVQHNTKMRIIFVLTRRNDFGEKFSKFVGSDENQEIIFAKE